MPFSEAATRIDPSEHLPTAKRIAAPLPPFAIIFRFHAKHSRGVRVKSAIRIKSCLVDRFGHRLAPSQLSAHPFGAMCRRIGLRGQSGGRFEETMEMEGTHASGIRQRGETGRFLSRLDSAARRRDQGRLSLSHALSVRMTSLTRTKSCLLRIRNRFKKSDMLSARSTSGAGGPAVHSSRLYAKNKTPVSPTISPQNCAPACVVGACK